MTESKSKIVISDGRISESFPPGSTNNFTYLADVHAILKTTSYQEDLKLSQEICIRLLNRESNEEIDQIKILFKEWFPQTNKDDILWKNICSGELEVFVATLDLSQVRQGHFIVGVVVFQEKSSQLEDLFPYMEVLREKTSTIYVNSIGVINELRTFRIGSRLLDKVKEEANKRKSVRYISLRMFEYNFSGEQFYLRNGFFKIRILNNASTFNDQNFSFFYFCHYINGGRAPPKFWQKCAIFLKDIEERFSYALEQFNLR